MKKDEMDFIKALYNEGLVESTLDEDALNRIQRRKQERTSKERNVALYGYMVGIENAYKAVKAVDLAQDGKAIPSSFIKGYLPLMEIIDDIIEAGPAHIQTLKMLHKRAKNSRK